VTSCREKIQKDGSTFQLLASFLKKFVSSSLRDFVSKKSRLRAFVCVSNYFKPSPTKQFFRVYIQPFELIERIEHIELSSNKKGLPKYLSRPFYF